MVYQYVACNEKGEVYRGRITANSEEAVNDMLSYAGYRLINLKPYVPFFSMERLVGQSKIKPGEIILLYRQLALLLESGINIVTSLELLKAQADNRTLKKVMDSIIADLRSGSQLSAAMSKHPRIFSTINSRTLSIGEQTGSLETMLRQVADYMEKELTTSKGVKGALTYPAILAVVTVIVVVVMVVFVLPAFAGLYADIGAELPAITRMMMNLSDFIRDNALTILIAVGAVIGAVMVYFRTAGGKYNLDKLLLKMPVLGRVNLLNELARACRSISLLYRAGLPLTEIMPLVIHGCTSRVMARSLQNVQQEMLEGEGLSQPMSRDSIFLPMMVQMVKVGEETGTLETTLMAVSQNYETEAADKTKAMIGMITPAMTLVIAGVVGLVAISMFSAMFSMYGQM